jgi:hypothetical protein
MVIFVPDIILSDLDVPLTSSKVVPEPHIKILSFTERACVGALFEIPTFDVVIKPVVELVNWTVFEVELPLEVASCKVIPPKRDVLTPESTTSFVVELYAKKFAFWISSTLRGEI